MTTPKVETTMVYLAQAIFMEGHKVDTSDAKAIQNHLMSINETLFCALKVHDLELKISAKEIKQVQTAMDKAYINLQQQIEQEQKQCTVKK